MGPFPVVPALGVDHPAVVQAQQELAGLVGDVDQVADQGGDLGLDVLGLERGRDWARGRLQKSGIRV